MHHIHAWLGWAASLVGRLAVAPTLPQAALLPRLTPPSTLPHVPRLARPSLQHGWHIDGAFIVFQHAAAATAAAKAIPSMELINNALVYAKELDRIV